MVFMQEIMLKTKLGNSETQVMTLIKSVIDKWDDASLDDNLKCFKKYIGLKLRLRRLQLGLTQTKVAKRLNVTFQQIQKYENGKNAISICLLKIFCETTETDLDWFFRPLRKVNKNISIKRRVVL